MNFWDYGGTSRRSSGGKTEETEKIRCTYSFASIRRVLDILKNNCHLAIGCRCYILAMQRPWKAKASNNQSFFFRLFSCLVQLSFQLLHFTLFDWFFYPPFLEKTQIQANSSNLLGLISEPFGHHKQRRDKPKTETESDATKNKAINHTSLPVPSS